MCGEIKIEPPGHVCRTPSLYRYKQKEKGFRPFSTDWIGQLRNDAPESLHWEQAGSASRGFPYPKTDQHRSLLEIRYAIAIGRKTHHH